MEIEELKRLCENDLYFLAKNILGYTGLEEDPHLEVCQYLEGPESKKLLLLPRGSFKTTIGTISRCIQEILRDPNIRILIFSETYNQSKKFLSEIKQQLEGNQEIIGLYGSFVKDPGWKEEEITVRQRTKKFKEGTIMTGGVDVVRVGFHYNLIIIDDPHSQRNVTTKEQIDKVRSAYGLLYPMLEPGGEININGTRWHFYDLASMILEDPSFAKMVRQAEVPGPDGKIKYFFPQRLSKQYLKERKYVLGSYLYSCQYQNNPVDDQNADFKLSWFRQYKEKEIEKLALNTFITIDPAVSQREEANFTGVIINSVDSESNWYIRRAMKLKIGPLKLIDKIFEWYLYWNPVKIGIEREKYSQVIKPFLDEEMVRRNIYPPIIELTPKESNKERRIRGLTPRYERGKVYHNEEDEGRIDLEDELLRFPKAQNDDLSDALSMQSDIVKSPGSNIIADYTQKKRYDKYRYKIRK